MIMLSNRTVNDLRYPRPTIKTNELHGQIWSSYKTWNMEATKPNIHEYFPIKFADIPLQNRKIVPW